MNFVAISFCVEKLDFTTLYMKTSRNNSAAALPALSVKHLTPVIEELFNRAYSTNGVALRDAAWEALLLFITPVLGLQCPDASSSSFNTEISARLGLWHRGKLDELSRRTKQSNAWLRGATKRQERLGALPAQFLRTSLRGPRTWLAYTALQTPRRISCMPSASFSKASKRLRRGSHERKVRKKERNLLQREYLEAHRFPLEVYNAIAMG